MRNPSRCLLVLHTDARFRARLRQGLRPAGRVEEYADWAALGCAIPAAPPTAVVIADAFHGTASRAELSPELRELLRQFPSATVVAVLDERAGYTHFWTLSRWGVSDVIQLGEDDSPVALARRLDALPVRPIQHLLDSLDLTGNPGARVLLEAAAEVAAAGGQPRDLARRLGYTRRTLLRRCLRVGMPSPRRLLLWLRALHAAALLDDPGHTVSSVALACGYASDVTLRSALRGVVPVPPGELRRTGAYAHVAAAFRVEVEACVRTRTETER
jgi:AraC-like DNA-binding protein